MKQLFAKANANYLFCSVRIIWQHYDKLFCIWNILWGRWITTCLISFRHLSWHVCGIFLNMPQIPRPEVISKVYQRKFTTALTISVKSFIYKNQIIWMQWCEEISYKQHGAFTEGGHYPELLHFCGPHGVVLGQSTGSCSHHKVSKTWK